MSVNMSGSRTRNEQVGAALSDSSGPAAVPNTNGAPINYHSHLFHFHGMAKNVSHTEKFSLFKVILRITVMMHVGILQNVSCL